MLTCPTCGDDVVEAEDYTEGETYKCQGCGVDLSVAIDVGGDCGCSGDCEHDGRASLVEDAEKGT